VRYRLIVPPEISRAIGAFGLDRNSLVMVLNRLYQELEERADDHKRHRDPAHPDLYFWFELTVWDHGRRRGFRFTVDDARAADHLFLVAAEEI